MAALLRFVLIAASTLAFADCGGTNPSIGPQQVTLGEDSVYVGTSSDACSQGGIAYCLRGPNVGYDVAVKQVGNTTAFQVSSSNASIVTGMLEMLGPAGQGNPAIKLAPHESGTASLTISGTGGSTATLPVTVTTVSKLTLTLSRLPTATAIDVSVKSPFNAACVGFVGGYSFEAKAPKAPAQSITYGNFPAMGSGPSRACLFTTIEFVVRDKSYVTLATKTVVAHLVIGQDNAMAITIP